MTKQIHRIVLGIVGISAFATVYAVSLRTASAVVATSAEAQIGQPNPGEWPGLLLLQTRSSRCSAVVVGPRVILTAAHCVQGNEVGATITVRVGEEETSLNRSTTLLNCEAHPSDLSTSEMDFALCGTDSPLPVSKIERVERVGTAIPRGSRLTLLGYGCREFDTRSLDGRLSQARGVVVADGRDRAAPRQITVEGSVACGGDGGGGAFMMISGPSSRVLVGIISRSDRKSFTLLAPTINETFHRWAREWSARRNVSICGISNDADHACTAQPNATPLARIEAPAMPSEVRATLGRPSLTGPAAAPVVTAAISPSASEASQEQRVAFRRGEPLLDALNLLCFGAADEAYMTRTLASLRAQGLVTNREHVFNADANLNIPVCPRWISRSADRPLPTIRQEVRPGSPTNLWYYFSRLSLARNPEFYRNWDFEWREGTPRTTQPGLSSRYFVEVFQQLNPGKDPRNLPIGWIELPLRPQLTTAPSDSALPLVREASDFFEPILDLQQFRSSGPQGPCTTRHDQLSYPFDAQALLDVLTSNKRQHGSVSESARVVIIDSGLYGLDRGEGPIQREFLSEAKNTITDRVFREYAGSLEPRLPKPLDAAHGTWVTSTVLGGPLFARIASASNMVPPIRVDPYRLHEAQPNGSVIIPAERFQRIFQDFRPRGTTIVNLSLRTSNGIASVERLLSPESHFLFVVAAGNGVALQGQYLQEGQGSSFPAIYGGRGRAGQANLISVAALVRREGANGAAWELAAFSDYNPDFIEIGAPGCSIPALHFDRETQLWSDEPMFVTGTSFAAPLVSFTAALLSSQMAHLSPAQVKQRLLTAADLEPALANRITDGRILNIVRSLAIYQDTIEVVPQSSPSSTAISQRGRLHRGTANLMNGSAGSRLAWNQRLPVTCLNERDGPILSNVLKIAPNYNRDAGNEVAETLPARIYVARGTGQQPEALQCRIPNNLVLTFNQLGTEGSISFNWSDVRDLTFRIQNARTE